MKLPSCAAERVKDGQLTLCGDPASPGGVMTRDGFKSCCRDPKCFAALLNRPDVIWPILSIIERPVPPR